MCAFGFYANRKRTSEGPTNTQGEKHGEKIQEKRFSMGDWDADGPA